MTARVGAIICIYHSNSFCAAYKHWLMFNLLLDHLTLSLDLDLSFLVLSVSLGAMSVS